MSSGHPVKLALVVALALLAVPRAASAEDAQAFVQQQHHRIEQLLRQPVSSARDTQIQQALSEFVDYGELTRRAFGEPCPPSEPSCEDLWAGYDDAQHGELRDLLEQLVRKTYQRNLVKTLDYDVTYRPSQQAGGDTRVRTEAKNRDKPHDAPVQVDYVVKETAGGPKVVDIITEGSSLTKNYYNQFRKKMHAPNEGYPNIVQKLREQISKP
ncbi:MAG TPA: ABC transporter substrate-binding protein [Polyangiaceae bacterium]|nr:ABC transporter substrate-binding protein [Polyangiaceae bacterium]